LKLIPPPPPGAPGLPVYNVEPNPFANIPQRRDDNGEYEDEYEE
jgi:hypothetical protein